MSCAVSVVLNKGTGITGITGTSSIILDIVEINIHPVIFYIFIFGLECDYFSSKQTAYIDL